MGIPIKDYPDYLIESNGNVYSLKTHKYLKMSKQPNGYLSVELFNEHGSKRLLIHRLVAMAYLDNPDNLPQVNHKDENRTNCDVSNLEWCTAKYNMNYGMGAKTRHTKHDYTKEIYKINARINGKKTSKPIIQIDDDGTIIQRFDSGKEASRITGLSHSHILECCTGKTHRKHVGGYRWQFERRDDLSVFQ